ncbi:MAG: hypothetical protein WCK02_15135 [Bacteroidota bacterium]
MSKFLSIIFIFAFLPLFSQVNVKDSVIQTTFLSAHYSYNLPGGDLKDRFGSNSIIGGKFSLKTRKNWIFEIQGNFIFGNTVNENSILDSLRNSDGNIINGNGEVASVNLFERGFSFTANAGKIFPVFGPNKNSGIVFSNGIGFLQHKIRIENFMNTVPQIKDDYKKGYDRLSNGFAMTQFLGYLYLGNKRIYSFYLGIEVSEAWTKSRRSYDFDLMKKDEKSRFDIMSGLKVGWIIPLYKRTPKPYYIN